MGILNKIFSGGAKELVEGVGGVLDNLTTTKAEKPKILPPFTTLTTRRIFTNFSMNSLSSL